MNEIRVCNRCGGIYTEAPALSRIDGSQICPICGIQEALEAMADYLIGIKAEEASLYITKNGKGE